MSQVVNSQPYVWAKVKPTDCGTKWRMAYRLPGKQSAKIIGKRWPKRGRPPAGYMSESQAHAYVEEFLKANAYRAGGVPTFEVAFESLMTLKVRKGRSANTIERWRNIAKNHLLPFSNDRQRPLGQRTLDEITKTDMFELHCKMLESVGYGTINHAATILNQVYKHAERAFDYEGPCPTRFFDRESVPSQTDYDCYDPEEVEALILASHSLQEACYYFVSAYCGLRRSEMRALRWRHVDFVGETIQVLRGYTERTGDNTTKDKEAHPVPMPVELAKGLARLRMREHFTADNHRVFCNEIGGPLGATKIYKNYKRAVKQAGLDRYLPPKQLRHCYGTFAVEVYPDISQVSFYMGHSDIKVTKRYLQKKSRPGDADAMNRFIQSRRGTNVFDPEADIASQLAK